ncbi:hypothetical protein DKX38_009619 [Salix brachista]|uniref:TFIIS N-terminal domain-containing protein n=1 Tax=Salix brachista TaxID=2182728 RepID=A0A5N5MB63_9ROSI|nr:hypothetical protein DKX38_009619 [Salix brachista]
MGYYIEKLKFATLSVKSIASCHKRSLKGVARVKNYVDDQEGAKTVDDDNFIDDSGVDPAYRYGNDIEPHSLTDAPQAEEGEEDDEIKQLFKMGKRRKKNEKSPAEIALLVENVMAELEVTAEEDADLNRQGKPAVNKLKKLPLLTEVLSKKQLQQEFIDHGVLTLLKNWLQPLSDGSLPNINIRAAILRILTDIDVGEWKGDILAVGVTEKDMTKDDNKRFENSLLKNLDTKLGGHLSEASSEEDFTGKPGQSMVLRVPGHGAKRIGFIGLGKSAANAYAFHNFCEAIAAAAKNAQANNSDSNKPGLKSVDILGFGTGPQLDKKLKYAEDVSSAVIFGKELLNSPANVLTRVVLAEEATKIASTYNDVFSSTILNAEQCKEVKMGSYLGVAAASENPPHFIHLCYKPPSGPIKAKLSSVFTEAQLSTTLETFWSQ